MVADTSFLIDLIRERTADIEGPAIKKLKFLGDTRMFLSLFTLCELRAGAELSRRPKSELRKIEFILDYIEILYPEASFPVFYGEAEAYLRKKGKPIPVMYLLIGITAKAAGLPVLTKDTRHFDLIPGLVVEGY
jgi:predicted nucleic acid-binding protein